MAAYSKPRGLLPMLFALVLFLQVTVALQHGAHHQHHHVARTPEEMNAHLEEMSGLLEKRANNIRIEGPNRNASPNVAPRLEIRDLQRNADQWNLYLLGMERFMAKPRNDRESYYQIAGVHGRPYISWNNFGPLVNRAGFCPHAQNLFGTWHRPYLAIFEQAWYNNVLEVINTFPASQQQRWRNAARTLRMPFWDWARNPGAGQPTVPTSIRDQYVAVTKPQGRVSIRNPLYSYSWGSSLPSEMMGGPWNNWATTLRRPVSNPTRSNNNQMNARFGSIRQSLANRIYGVFMTRASWGYVSTSAIGVRTSQNGNNPDSIESIHDAIHVTAGGESGGHMYYLDYSSFDPIFWLHHTNVDRLLAMYQLVSPNTWVAIGNTNRPMAQWNAGETKNSNTPLKPFTSNTQGDFFTSNQIRDTRVFNYVYPETNGRTGNDVIREVTRMYGPGSTASRKRDASGPYPGRKFQHGDYNTVLSVIANKYALAGSMAVHCFLGKPSSNSTSNSTTPYPISNSTSPYTNTTADYTEDPNYVGMYAVMGGSQASSNNSYAVMTEGSLPLTTALQGKQAAGELKSLHPSDVEPYLAEHLHYKVIGPGDVELDPEQVPDLHVYVKACAITPAASDDELPTLGTYTTLPHATKNKPAGKPFVYVPNPLDYFTPGPGEENGPNRPTCPDDGEGAPPSPSATIPGVSYPTGAFPYPTAPEMEPGYCVVKQVVEYVDAEGKLIKQMHY